jgi:hypothetical protein
MAETPQADVAIVLGGVRQPFAPRVEVELTEANAPRASRNGRDQRGGRPVAAHVYAVRQRTQIMESRIRMPMIANSSLNWWAAWLRENQGEVVSCPGPWHTVESFAVGRASAAAMDSNPKGLDFSE